MAEELRSLLDALASRAEPLLHKVGSTADPQHTPTTCNWCPVCASMALMRGQRPELAVRAAEHAAGLLAVFRAAMQEHAAHGHADAHGPEHGPADFAGPAAQAEPRTSDEPATRARADRQRVQKIELRRPGGAGGPGRHR